ncbi:MAG: hypothetical protein FWF15_01805 [Oscillospiraceae bacterium]|nr:hypothetical protein [Oscillospiraceae bacterium]
MLSQPETNKQIWDTMETINTYIDRVGDLLLILIGDYLRHSKISDDAELTNKYICNYRAIQTLVVAADDYIGFVQREADKIYNLLREEKKQA